MGCNYIELNKKKKKRCCKVIELFTNQGDEDGANM